MKDNSSKKSVAGGLAWKLGERFLCQGASLVVSVILTRLLTPADYGAIALVEVFTDLCYVVFFVGLASGLIQDREAEDGDFSTMFFCALAVALGIYALLFAIAPWFAGFYAMPELRTVLRVFALQIPLSIYHAIQVAYVSRHGLFRKLFVSSFVSVAVSGGVGIAMAWAGLGVWALVTQTILLTVVNSIVLTFLLPWRLKLCFRRRRAAALLRYSTRIMGAELSNSVFGHLRSLSVGRVFSGEALAFFQKAMVFPNLVTANVSNSVIAVVFPALSDIQEDPRQIRDMTLRSSYLLCFVMLPILMGLAAVMEPLVALLYTETWLPCVPYAQVMCLALAFSVPNIIPLQALKAMGLSRQVLWMELLKKIPYALLLILGLRRSVLALAWAMVVYEGIGSAVSMLCLKKHLGVGLVGQLRAFLPALVLSALMAACVLAVPVSGMAGLGLKLLTGVAVYAAGAALARLKAWGMTLDMLKTILHKNKEA